MSGQICQILLLSQIIMNFDDRSLSKLSENLKIVEIEFKLWQLKESPN